MLSPILSVHDIDVSIAFYVNALNFSEKWKLSGDDGSTNFACVSLGDAEILLGTIDFVTEEHRQLMGIGIQIYVEVPAEIGIDAIYKSATSAAANITRPIEDREWGERVFTARDPDGYNLMLAQRQ